MGNFRFLRMTVSMKKGVKRKRKRSDPVQVTGNLRIKWANNEPKRARCMLRKTGMPARPRMKMMTATMLPMGCGRKRVAKKGIKQVAEIQMPRSTERRVAARFSESLRWAQTSRVLEDWKGAHMS